MTAAVGYDDARVCTTCRVLAVPGDAGAWVHPPELREKFSRDVCDQPKPGRAPSGHETRYGRGRSRTSYVLHEQIAGLDQAPGTPLTVGVDGSYKLSTGERGLRKPISWAYLTTSGLYGLGTTVIPGSLIGGDRALQGELRAMYYALTRRSGSFDDGGEPLRLVDLHPVELLTDSLDAVQLCDAWRAGEEDMPRGYTVERDGGKTATLVKLAQLINQAQDRVRVRWVRGHSGEPLNEGADALAKMARAWATGRLTRQVVAEDARGAALAALHRHADRERR